MRRKIKAVYVWPNGMVMVFDEQGQQMPRYQGEWARMKDKILARFDGVVEYMPTWADIATGRDRQHVSDQ